MTDTPIVPTRVDEAVPGFEIVQAELNARAGTLPDSALVFYRPAAELSQFLADLCRAYLEADAEQRARLRQTAARDAGLLNHLLGYVYEASERLRTPQDRQWLRLALAAASIQDNAFDFPHFIMALTHLYLAAEEAGIDPASDFATVADLSSAEPSTGGGAPVYAQMRGIQYSANLDGERRRRARSKSSATGSNTRPAGVSESVGPWQRMRVKLRSLRF